MEKEGEFVNIPPLLDGTNYDYWKSRMSAYLKSIDWQDLESFAERMITSGCS